MKILSFINVNKSFYHFGSLPSFLYISYLRLTLAIQFYQDYIYLVIDLVKYTMYYILYQIKASKYFC